MPRDTLDVIGYQPLGIEDGVNVPQAFSLEQNYPNPFNPSTKIRYTINKAGIYRLTIYNVLGQQIRTLVNNVLMPNQYEVTWDGRSDSGQKVGSGIYFYQLSGAGNTITHKMILLK